MSREADSPLGKSPVVNAAGLTALEPWAQEPGKWNLFPDPCKLQGNKMSVAFSNEISDNFLYRNSKLL